MNTRGMHTIMCSRLPDQSEVWHCFGNTDNLTVDEMVRLANTIMPRGWELRAWWHIPKDPTQVWGQQVVAHSPELRAATAAAFKDGYELALSTTIPSDDTLRLAYRVPYPVENVMEWIRSVFQLGQTMQTLCKVAA